MYMYYVSAQGVDWCMMMVIVMMMMMMMMMMMICLFNKNKKMRTAVFDRCLIGDIIFALTKL